MSEERKPMEELTIKFGKGLVEDFTGKDGKEYKRIMIPNNDPEDHSPWASFVLPAKMVHENQYGNGLWAKIPVEAHTTVTKPERIEGVDGETIWENHKSSVPNAELKAMVEAYKTRTPQDRESDGRKSARAKLGAMVKETAEKLSPEHKYPRVRGSTWER